MKINRHADSPSAIMVRSLPDAFDNGQADSFSCQNQLKKLASLTRKGNNDARPQVSGRASGIEEETAISSVSLLAPTPTFPAERPPTPKPSECDPGPLGLNVVYTPNNGHKADIVFVHGLGGTSHLTWSKYRNPALFWPLTFLPLEPDLCLARILTFGYNASLHKAGNATTSVLDFAKDLLFDLKYAKDEQREDLNMGKVRDQISSHGPRSNFARFH